MTERKHSKYSASGAERWFNCPGSIALSEGLPDKSSPAAMEGTRAHEVLEWYLRFLVGLKVELAEPDAPSEMIGHAVNAARCISNILNDAGEAEILVEERVLLDFIHPEAFGSLDAAVIEHFGTLHIFDYKYGKTLVSPKKNLQFLFYALAVARKYDWNFHSVRMWTLQPRVRGYDGYMFWEISIDELRTWVPVFEAAIGRVEKYPDLYVEGDWCYFCKAKGICPLKTHSQREKTLELFD